MSENSGKTVEVRDLPSRTIRLFADRKPIEIDIPQEVQDTTENCPLTVTITPMTHREAEVRKRIKKALSVEMSKSNRLVGITAEDIHRYNVAYCELLEHTDELEPTDSLKCMIDFQQEWDSFKSKIDSKDLTAYYAEEDRLHDNALGVIASNVVSLNWDDNTATITKDNVECLHPDLIAWLLVQIESNSYLDEGEIMGF